MTQDRKISVAFVCLGNYCRSPMAEAVFKYTVKQHGLEDRFEIIDSFGTGDYHVGSKPDSRSTSTCKQHSVPVDHYAQQLKPKNFKDFDFIIGMDEMNIRNIKRIQPKDSRTNVCLFGEWNTDGKFDKIVDDPYYGGDDGFQYNFEQIQYFSEQFLKREL